MREEPRDFFNPHEDYQNAGNQNQTQELKKGAKPKKIVENTANFIDYKISCKEISEDNVYIFVDYDDKHFIVTLRYCNILYREGTRYAFNFGHDRDQVCLNVVISSQSDWTIKYASLLRLISVNQIWPEVNVFDRKWKLNFENMASIPSL